MEEKREKISLWTRQDQRFLDVIEKEGVFRTKREYIEEKNDTLSSYYFPLYDWFVEEANKRVARPEGALYPIWCSVNEDYMLRGAHGNVLVELSVERDRILYFNSLRWDLVLNHTYIPTDKQDAQRFSQKLKDLGVKNSFSFLDKDFQRFYPDLVEEVKQSWQRIFDIDPEKEDLFTVQANLWEVWKEDIVSISTFEEDHSPKAIRSYQDHY